MSVKKEKQTGRFTAKLVSAAVLLLGFQALTGSRSAQSASHAGEQNTLRGAMLQELANAAGKALYETYIPTLVLSRESSHETYWLLQEQIDSVLPFYGYLREGLESESEGAETALRESLLKEARGESGDPGEEEDFRLQEGADQHSGNSDLAQLLQAENEAALRMQQENQWKIKDFVPHVQQVQVDLESLQNYETLVKEFYTVDSNTMAGSDQLDVNRLMARDLSITADSSGPQILIYHTHSQEEFADSVPGDDSTNIQGVGEYLARILQDTYGYQVLHHTGEYDLETRDTAYANSLPAIEQVLAENPTIQVVIDLHRDEVPEGTRLVMDLEGRPTARFMFFNGLSRTKTTGNIAYLYNENLEDNLAFSFQMQLKAAEYYPGLTRKIYLKGYRYNMHLKPRYLLVELGAQNNTLEEALNACDPLAHILDMVLSGQ